MKQSEISSYLDELDEDDLGNLSDISGASDDSYNDETYTPKVGKCALFIIVIFGHSLQRNDYLSDSEDAEDEAEEGEDNPIKVGGASGRWRNLAMQEREERVRERGEIDGGGSGAPAEVSSGAQLVAQARRGYKRQREFYEESGDRVEAREQEESSGPR